MLRIFSLSAFATIVVVAVAAGSAEAQLRVVTYNTTGAPRDGMNVVLRSIGEEQRNGIAKPIDVLLLQETSRTSGLPDTQAFVNLLNSMYAGQTHNGEAITYARGNLAGNASFSGDSGQSIVYRQQSVQLVSEAAIGSVSGSGQARQAMRYRLRPAGYTSGADFYVYNSHYKASPASNDPDAPDRRNIEAIATRNNANSLGEGTHIIYAGDFNFYDSDEDEPAWGTLTAAGAGQALDPVNRVGTWSNNASFADVHTQSPCFSNCVGATSGVDDRFDFQLVTNEFLDGEGLSYISNSYHTFGNNGSTYNTNINSGSNTVTFPGVTSHTKSQILNALWGVTDHLPVVADYQLPAVMNAIATAIPATLQVGEAFQLELTVWNAANVLAPLGADELDYSITTTFNGALQNFSRFDQMDMALGGKNVYQIALDTSTPGEKLDLLSVASGSQGVQNALLQFPIQYEVLAATLAGDFNGDGTVDTADYTVWRDGLGTDYDQDDYMDWKNHFGQSWGSGGVAVGDGTAAVPEPGAMLLAAWAVCLLPRRLSCRWAAR